MNPILEAMKTIQQYVQSANKPELQAAFESLLRAMQGGETKPPVEEKPPVQAPVGTGRAPYNAGAKEVSRVM